MKYLIFAKLNTNHFLFISFFFLFMIRSIINDQSPPTQDIVKNFHFSFLYSLSDFLSIIPVIIIYKRSRSTKINSTKIEKKDEKVNAKEEEFIHTDTLFEHTNKKSRKIFKLFIVISIFDFLAQYIQLTFFIIQRKSNVPTQNLNLNCVLIIHIIAQYLSNRIILHYLFYKHHYLSLIINIIFLIALGAFDIRDIHNSGNDPIISFLFVLTNMLNMAFYSIEDAFAKIVLTYNSVSPYHYLLYRGLMVNFIVFIFAIIFIFVDIPDENGENSCVYTRLWKLYEDKINILLYIAYFIVGFLFNSNIFFIIDKFTSTHLPASNIFGNFAELLSLLIILRKISVSEFFLRFALYIILIIAASIHCEFMILKFCGFEKHTKLFLEEEAENDLHQNNEILLNRDSINSEEYDESNQRSSLIELNNY